MNNKQTAVRGQGGNTPVQPANQSQLSAANLSEHELDDILSTRAAKRFLNENPEYYPTKPNSDLMQKFVRENGLNGHYSDSWQQAFDALTVQGRLEQRPGISWDEWEEKPTERHTMGKSNPFTTQPK
jgi:hypothetical protein